MPSRQLRAAVIGTSGTGMLHAKAYESCAGSRLVAVCGRDRAKAGIVGAKLGVAGYGSIEEMIERERPDVVSVVTGEYDHELPVQLSLAAGCHILCEKPLAHTLEAARDLRQAAFAAGKQLAVNYNYRTTPLHRAMAQLLRAGRFGEKLLFEATVHPYLFPHVLDLILFFFGPPDDVKGSLVDKPEMRPVMSPAAGRGWDFSADILYHPSVAATGVLGYGNAIVTISSSAFIPIDEQFWSFSLFGERANLFVDRATGNNLNGTLRSSLADGVLSRVPSCTYEETFKHSVGSFVDAIISGSPLVATGDDGLTALALDAAIVTSSREGRAVTFAQFSNGCLRP